MLLNNLRKLCLVLLSRPARARGLKFVRAVAYIEANFESRPARARGLKLWLKCQTKIWQRRALRGRVD